MNGPLKISKDAVLLDFPNYRQYADYTCGPSVLQAVLAYYGLDVNERALARQLETNSDRGTTLENIVKVSESYGLKSEFRDMNIEDIRSFINRKIPCVLLIQAWADDKNVDYKNHFNDGHYVAAIGYDSNGFIFQDPHISELGYIPFSGLMDRWHSSGSSGGGLSHPAAAIYGKEPTFKNNQIRLIE